MKNSRISLLLILVPILLLSACGGASGDAASSIENYIEAVIAQDIDAAVNASCAGWEADARTEVISFDGVTAHIEGMACSVSGTDGDTTLVSCVGDIIATYAGEDRPLPLSDRTYQVVNQGGEWRMCGYK